MDPRDDCGYVPIPCAEHERLELSVLRHLQLGLRYLSEEGQEQEATGMPLDVQTRQCGEWLMLRLNDGRVIELRLDRLLHLNERPFSGGSSKVEF